MLPHGSRALALVPLLAACGDASSSLDAALDIGPMARIDAGLMDLGGGTVDSGVVTDSGLVADSGVPTDSGVSDTGAPDSGVVADSGVLDMGGGGLCPPRMPFGTQTGAVFPDLVLPDCDGNMVSLHASCAKKAAYFFVYADW